MTALTQDHKTDKAGPDDVVYPGLLKYPVDTATTIYGGAIVAIDAAGYAASTATPVNTMKVVGRCERQVANQTTGGTTSPDGIATGTAGSISVQVRQGFFYYDVNADTTLTVASFGANLYASDDHTLSTSDAGGTRPYAGWCFDPGGTYSMDQSSTTQVGVALGFPNPYSALAAPAFSTVGKARVVVTTLDAYTGSGTNVLTETTAASGFGAQDGVTLAVGDVVFIQGGTTNLTAAKDQGAWQVTNLGTASVKWVLTRPDWFTTGAVLPVGQVINVGGEGAVWGGTEWKAMAAKGSLIVGTSDLKFYVGRMSQKVTLTASTATVSNVGLFSASVSAVIAQFQLAHGTTTSTIGYGVIAAPTPGYAGTASIVIDALGSGMGKNGASDASDLIVTIINW